MTFLRRLLISRLFYPFLFLGACLIFLFHYSVALQAVYGDGIDYWAYLHSWYFDRDINFTNEFKHIYNHEYNNAHPEIESPVIQKTNITDTGQTENFHPFGAPLLLLPSYVGADIFVVVANHLGFSLLRNGYSDTYQIVTGISAIAFVIAGLYLCELTAKKYVGEAWIRRLAVLTIFLSSVLFYYGSFDVLNSHFASFFVSSLFWYVFIAKRKRMSAKLAVILGLIIGLAVLVRLQEIILFIPLGIGMFLDRLEIKKIITYGILSLATSFAVLTPMFWEWHVMFGGWLHTSYTQMLLPGPVWGSLFHPTQGFFSRTPLMFFVFLFLPLLIIKFGKLRSDLIPMLVLFVAYVLLFAIQGGWMSAAYGARMYISLIPISIPIFAICVQRISRKWADLPIYITIFFAVFNLLNIGSFVLYEKQTSGTTGGTEPYTKERLQRVLPFIQ